MKWLTFVLLGLAASAHADEELRTTTLPGLRVPLPRWREHANKGDFSGGMIQLEGLRRNFSLVWQVGVPPTHEMRKKALQPLAEGEVVVHPPRTITVAGHPGESFSARLGHNVVVVETWWYCPIDGRSVVLDLLGDGDEGELRKLEETIVSGIACHTVKAESRPRPSYPSFKPPPGFQRKDQPGNPTHAFVDEAGQIYALPPALPGSERAHEFATEPKTRAMMLSLLIPDAVEGPGTRRINGRQIWTATASMNKRQVHLGVESWYCANSDRTFFAAFLGHSPAAVDEAAEVLARIECPSR